MIRKLLLLTCASAAVFSLGTARADDVIEDFMKEYHKAPKGTDPVCKKATNGAASADELAGLLKGYQAICAEAPPKGEKADWVKKCQALVAAVKGLQAGDAGAADAYKKAVNCKGCHSEHKPD
ncbi:MAG: hypothetical protein KDM64_11935 [Verrucomicrobiae bacterium]|nr:hypothetical protein [Verrucomicrobiae bacterium]